MRRLVSRFIRSESGATAIEYGLIAALIGVAIITVVGQVGVSLKTDFTKAKAGMDSVK